MTFRLQLHVMIFNFSEYSKKTYSVNVVHVCYSKGSPATSSVGMAFSYSKRASETAEELAVTEDTHRLKLSDKAVLSTSKLGNDKFCLLRNSRLNIYDSYCELFSMHLPCSRSVVQSHRAQSRLHSQVGGSCQMQQRLQHLFRTIIQLTIPHSVAGCLLPTSLCYRRFLIVN